MIGRYETLMISCRTMSVPVWHKTSYIVYRIYSASTALFQDRHSAPSIHVLLTVNTFPLRNFDGIILLIYPRSRSISSLQYKVIEYTWMGRGLYKLFLSRASFEQQADGCIRAYYQGRAAFLTNVDAQGFYELIGHMAVGKAQCLGEMIHNGRVTLPK